jgi:pimeloyl-ACP methyl ester carboxylesterase
VTAPAGDQPPTGGPRLVAVSDDLELAVWDAGGSGEPVVLMHSAWGSGELWAPQLTSFAASGLRPIAWSRRGHFGSGTGGADPGTVVQDIDDLARALDLGTFHLVGTAYGGFGATDYTLSRPARVRSLTLASTLAGITDPDYVATTRTLVPQSWETLPITVRELSATYRFQDPAGVDRWAALTDRAVHTRVHQNPTTMITRAALGEVTVPTLFVTGDADPYLPPPRMRELAALVPGARCGIVPSAGHSPSWENPDEFDELVVRFLDGRHGDWA